VDTVFALFVIALAAVIGGGALLVLVQSFKVIGPTDVGLVTKRFGRKLAADNVIAMHGEAGFQQALLMPGLRFKLWPIYSVTKYPWVQVPAGGIGLVIAQVGSPLPVGAKSAVYRPEFGDFSNVERFLAEGGQRGVQRRVLPPGTLAPIHPVAFLVITSDEVYGEPVSSELIVNERGALSPQSFGLAPMDLSVTVISSHNGSDQVGIVYALEGDPLPKGAIACRLGDYTDVEQLEHDGASHAEIVGALLGNKNQLHNNYQDFQGFSTTAAGSGCSTTRCFPAPTS
jgi:hypothetical protein